MKNGLMYLVFFAFAMMLLQSVLSYVQYKSYQKAVDSMRGKGFILGIGMRKGGFQLKGGAIVILAWDQKKDRVMACKKLSGIAMWKRFEAIEDYNGMTLNAVRMQGVTEDAAINSALRKKEPYSPLLVDKRRKKGALIQAVEAIDKRLAQEMAQAEVSAREPEYDLQTQKKRIEERKRKLREQAKKSHENEGGGKREGE